ncbi:acyl-homoserine-lactone synthase [uncultured Albimonas sp.]|uniref:acyl-homoserine-lactone synthase n=1 Tax=uncultured Albimonas sp. TaxID=1331701 RepID=UPI0030EC6773|tara:strand:+ start:17353 stop:17982 length:630 start_codon:yes stop_codon:yes gene_type:complete
MIRYVYAHELHKHPQLVDQMFRDRSAQFRDRMKWDVTVDENGWERDQYDALAPLYIIYERPDGTHAGSGRLMPTTGRTMIGEHFSHLTDGVVIQSPTIWEITRLCISPSVKSRREAMNVTSSLLLAGIDVGLRFGLEFYVGVFDEPMLRVYKGLDFTPDVMGKSGEDRRAICAGLWPCTEEVRNAMARKVEEHDQIAEAAQVVEFAIGA